MFLKVLEIMCIYYFELFVTYNDANNQYGWTMSQYLPCAAFRWLDQSKIPNINPDNYSNVSSFYIHNGHYRSPSSCKKSDN